VETGEDKTVQIGTLIGTYETGNRITCLDAFVMRSASDGFGGLSEFEGLTEAEDESDSEVESD
jgi:protein MAK11